MKIKKNLLNIKNPTTGEWEKALAIQGESAYDIAVRLGTFSGTEEEFNNQIVSKEYIDSKVNTLVDNEVLIDNVASKVPYVKVAQEPTFVNSINEMTDTSKAYVLTTDGMFYTYTTKVIITEPTQIPNFTNLLDDPKSYTKLHERYSHSSQKWVDTEGKDVTSYIVPVPYNTTITLRVKNLFSDGWHYIYGGIDGTTFPISYGPTFTSQGDLVTAEFNTGNADYITFTSRTGYVEVITVNEEITYTSVGGEETTITEWHSTGISYNQPSDCEGRVIILENEVKELEDKDEELLNKITQLEENNNIPIITQGGGIEFVNSENEFTDTNKLYVLPNGKVYAYKGTGTGAYIPNFTNLLDDPTSYTEHMKRWSLSGLKWTDTGSYDVTSYVIPVPSNTTITLRIKNHYGDGWYYIYGGGTSDRFTLSLGGDNIGERLNVKDELLTVSFNTSSCNYITFTSRTGYVEAVTIDEEITYTYDDSIETYAWTDTGYSFVKGESPTTSTVQSGVFDIPALAPSPQLPADGSQGSDFDYKTATTQDAYNYMNVLCNKFTQYITKQTIGKDATNTFDHNRYILVSSYWKAWVREGYLKMYAWKNGETVIYSVSVSPRIYADSDKLYTSKINKDGIMYSTPYVGTEYGRVTSVNVAPGVLSTRTVNGLEFVRYEEGDIEPTLVYTKPPTTPIAYLTMTLYNSSFTSTGYKISQFTDDYNTFTGTDGYTYSRYPFGDRKENKSEPISIFILSNEHGMHGDDKIPSFTVMRFANDLCRNTQHPFIKWVKENCIVTMIPVGTPWGYSRHLESGNTSGYYNANGCNINRNYDTPGWANSDTNYGDTSTFGAYPGCENETQNIMNTMRLCKPNVGISMHSPGFGSEFKDMKDNAYFIWQGQGFDNTRTTKIAEVLYNTYSMGASADVGSPQHYNNCGKSPAYIQYCGAIGGLTETVTQESGTNNTFTPMAMEQAYSQMLLFLQTWIKEYLDKND